ncbi:MAG TPA: AAA family ATPase [Thermomicrobiales bacterium]|nr:AAA family ATPase [Thermomicrobiales bacterium]
MSSLILINGAPGSGKSTLARLLVDEQPLALLLDIDTLRGQLGQWSADPQAAGMTARRLALAMIRTHLEAGLDVVVPQFLFRSPFIVELERVAGVAGGRFVEIALVSSSEEAAARFEARAESADPNHRDAVQLQRAAGARPIEELYREMIAMLRQERPATRFVESVPGDILQTLISVRAAIRGGTSAG